MRGAASDLSTKICMLVAPQKDKIVQAPRLKVSRVVGLLHAPEPRVLTAASQQLGVCAALRNEPLAQHEDLVGVHHGRQAVCNHDGSAIRCQGVQ